MNRGTGKMSFRNGKGGDNSYQRKNRFNKERNEPFQKGPGAMKRKAFEKNQKQPNFVSDDSDDQFSPKRPKRKEHKQTSVPNKEYMNEPMVEDDEVDDLSDENEPVDVGDMFEVPSSDDEFEENLKKGNIAKLGKAPKTGGMEEADDNEDVEDDDEDEDEEEEEDVTDGFRQNMANLPLSKVRELKEKLGIKLFNKAYFGTKGNDSKKSEEKAVKEKEEEVKKKGQHRPREISSKKRVGVYREIYQNEKKIKKWDPRFDERAGTLKEHCFEDNYGFLEDIRKNEKEELRKELQYCMDNGDERAESIAMALRRLEDQDRARKEKKLRNDAMSDIRQENIDRMMAGQKPIFKTRAEVRMKVMEKKYDQLKEENKLSHYLKKKSQKSAQKEKKMKPSTGFESKYGYV